MTMVWKGVIIEESLEDKTLLDMVNIVGTREATLKQEEERGVMHLHLFEVEDAKRTDFVEKAKSAIKQSWYIHIAKDETIVVIFKNKSFEFSVDEEDKVQEAKDYAMSIGINAAQIGFTKLARDPHSEKA